MSTKSDLEQTLRVARERAGVRRTRDLRGGRSVDEAWAVRQARRERPTDELAAREQIIADASRRYAAYQLSAAQRPLAVKLRRLRAIRDAQLRATYIPEIERRGGETTIEGDRDTSTLDVEDTRHGLVLLRAEGWRQYSRRFGARPATLAYLCGRDDGDLFAVRVPGTCTTVREAIEAITPAEVQRARRDGRHVLRQGDVYVIEMRRDRADATADELPERHHWDAERRVLQHEGGHEDLDVPWPAKFVPQHALGMGRGARRGMAD